MKKILAILLTLCMVAWTIPAAAFAEGDDTGTAVDLTKAVISISSGGGKIRITIPRMKLMQRAFLLHLRK